MKHRTITFLCLILMTSSTFAVTVFCKADRDENIHNLSVEKIGSGVNELECKILDIKNGVFETSRTVKMKLEGRGIGMRYAEAEGFMINCPSVFSVDKLTKNTFYGVKASVAVVYGTSVGIFSNKRLGICIMNSLSGGAFAVGLTGAKLKFKPTAGDP